MQVLRMLGRPVGGLAMALLAVALVACSSGASIATPAATVPAVTPTLAPTATVSPVAEPAFITITEPASGTVIGTDSVVVRGTAPAGSRVVRDIRLGADDDAVVDAAGRWFMAVPLAEGPNALRFRIGDDESTEVDWLVILDSSLAVAPTQPTATAAPTVAPEPTPTQTPSRPPSPTATLPPTAPPTPEPPQDFIEFFDGTHEIGVDIPAGTYRTEFDTSGCYWARLSGFGGSVDDIIANSFSSGYQVVTIGRRDVGFESTGCDFWTSDLSAVTDSDQQFGEGTFIVGTDISPGTYQSSDGDSCYWARLSGFGGTLQDIIANDFGSGGGAIVQIRAKDVGFTSTGCGTWTTR